MNAAFIQLINDLCTVIRFPRPERLIAGDGVAYEGVNFAVVCKPATEREAFFLYADFGRLDLEQQAILFPLLLKENFMMLSSRECTFSVSPSLDSVVLIEKIPLAGMTADGLLALIRSLARRANYFNKHHRAGAELMPRPRLHERAASRPALLTRDQASC